MNEQVKIVIGDNEYTVEEARELYEALGKIFGDREIVTIPFINPIYPYPTYPPSYPLPTWIAGGGNGTFSVSGNAGSNVTHASVPTTDTIQ